MTRVLRGRAWRPAAATRGRGARAGGEAATREYLGCSGQVEALEDVDESDVTYHLDAWFRSPYDDEELPPSILDGRTVELQVSEDDDLPCPAPPSEDDEMIGISGPIDRAMVDDAPMLTFGRVVELRLEID